MSPFKDRRIPKQLTSEYPDRDPVTGERIYTLETYKVRPMVSDIEIFLYNMRENFDQFKTEQRWKAETMDESSVDAALSPSFLPTLALSKEAIARMRARDRQMDRRLSVLDAIIETNRAKGGSYGDDLDQQRFELMKMKRESINFFFDDDS